ncbi:MAG: Veg family protein [Bacilli bacterium]|nr:Veg family protein [Bacilli bacterium]
MLDILDKGVYDNKTIKKALSHYQNKQVTIKYDLGRNKYEIYPAIIKNLYSSVFLVELCNDKKTTKSFSYADIITKTIKIYDN